MLFYVMTTFYTVAALSRLLGTDRSSLDYHIRAGHIPPPTHFVGAGKRYDAVDVEAISRWWRARVPLGVSRFTAGEIATMAVLYGDGMTQKEIAERFGTTQTAVSYYLTGRVLPGWKGGATGRGRVQLQRRTRRRNRSR
jgi:hypothetical protein